MYPSIIHGRYFTVESFEELGQFKNEINIKNDIENINIESIEKKYSDKVNFLKIKEQKSIEVYPREKFFLKI